MNKVDIEQPEALQAYLEQKELIRGGEAIVMQPLFGGVSNRTVLVKRPDGTAWVFKQALAKLRVQVDWFSSPTRVHREALGLRWLEDLVPSEHIVHFLFEDFDNHILGMAAVPEPHANWKSMLLAGDLHELHVRQFGQLLGTIHRRAWQQQAKVATAFADRSFFESLRLEPYYGFAAEQVSEATDFLYTLIEDTRQQQLTLVHGDYSPKNVLVYQDNLILLDHEVIHFGDPTFDLGFSMTHFLSKAHHLPTQRKTFADAARLYWQSYLFHLGDVSWLADLETRAVRQTLGCLLARVAGRSLLEYLSREEQIRQQAVVVELMKQPPLTMADLIDQFSGAF